MQYFSDLIYNAKLLLCVNTI